MPGSRELKGISASPGYAAGSLFDLDRPLPDYVAKGAPEAERSALQQAIDTASAALSGLIAAADGEAADILEFQLAMIEDAALTGPAFAAIGQGSSADVAWTEALEAEIAGYESAEDDYFRARAADLRDIRDQVYRALVADAAAIAPDGAILFGTDIAPTRFLQTDWAQGGGIALKSGSSASHVAMLARSRGVPMVVGLGAQATGSSGDVLLDAEHGSLVFDPSERARDQFTAMSAAFSRRRMEAGSFLGKPAVTKNGIAIGVQVNISDPSDIQRMDIANCDGVGLMRTEFLFGKTLPGEESQYFAYRRVLEWAAGKPVTIRTVDAGGDKPVPGFTVEETNPFLGLRGIRLSLARSEVFRVQIRALLRAAVHGKLKVMLPMVAVKEEYARAAALFAEESAILSAAGVAHAMPPLGIMVEVPSVAIAPEQFSNVAFFSIGSNDLTQYVMAAARDNGTVAALNSVRNPAVLRLIGQVAAFGKANDIPVSLCGDAGGDPAVIPHLIAAGMRDLSVVPAQLALAKAAIAEVEV